MTNSINLYVLALGQYFPFREYRKDLSKVTHYLILSQNTNGLKQWLDPKTKEGEDPQEKLSQRVNAFATNMHLHPLHMCAMFEDRLEMAKMLLETGVCMLNPQDNCGFTPLHHAAINNFQDTIALLLSHGADPSVLNGRGATYLKVMQLVHPSIEPLKQVFFYKDPSGKIVQKNGEDFTRLTGTTMFLDREAVMSVPEAIRQWEKIVDAKISLRPELINMIKEAYDRFLSNPPRLYLEKREKIGWNVCALDDIEEGTIVTEFLGQDETYCDVILKEEIPNPYVFMPFNAEKKRGIGALINDSFPNCHAFVAPNLHGLLKRVLFMATTKIPKGSTVAYNYGYGKTVKFDRHQEMSGEEMTAFFQQYSHFSSEDLLFSFASVLKSFFEAKEDETPSYSIYDIYEKFTYLCTTPHAILKVVCDQTLTFDAIYPLCYLLDDLMGHHYGKNDALTTFLDYLKDFSETLKVMKPEKAQEWRDKVLKALPEKDVEGLQKLLHSVDPEAWAKKVMNSL